MSPAPRLELRLGQQLALTPQLQQALKLLQLSAIELSTKIEQALEENAMLERIEPDEASASGASNAESDEISTPLDNPDDAGSLSWSSMPTTTTAAKGAGSGHGQDPDFIPETAGSHDLYDYLEWQLELERLNTRDREIASAIVDAIDADGYLRVDLNNIIGTGPSNTLDPLPEAPEIEAVLHRVQNLDPPGIGARNPKECLRLQLRQFSPETPGLVAAESIVDDHLDTLAEEGSAGLAKRLTVDMEELESALALIRSLHPRPGRNIGNEEPEYIVPDLMARRIDRRWQVELNPAIMPKLAVNEHYAAWLANQERGEEIQPLRRQLQEARWLIKSLSMRNDTLLRVGQCLVDVQSAFLDRGDIALKPLTLRDIADRLGMHESTISRVTTRKYIATPRGTYELKQFFSSQITNPGGIAHSATAIQARIREIIGGEEPSSPLSDGAIAQELARQGISVARRTIAKYREAMSIPSTRDRKRPTFKL